MANSPWVGVRWLRWVARAIDRVRLVLGGGTAASSLALPDHYVAANSK